MDEGFADFFTAAYTRDSRIYGRGAEPVRNLHQLWPYLYDPCAGRYCSDPYYGARVFGGALWDLREALVATGVDGPTVDRAIYDAIIPFAQVYGEPGGRTFLHYRDQLLATTFGKSHDHAIRNAFARHNIADMVSPVCFGIPVIDWLNRSIDEAGQHIQLTFTRVPAASWYRVYKRSFGRP
jgi:hypothetical protein